MSTVFILVCLALGLTLVAGVSFASAASESTQNIELRKRLWNARSAEDDARDAEAEAKQLRDDQHAAVRRMTAAVRRGAAAKVASMKRLLRELVDATNAHIGYTFLVWREDDDGGVGVTLDYDAQPLGTWISGDVEEVELPRDGVVVWCRRSDAAGVRGSLALPKDAPPTEVPQPRRGFIVYGTDVKCYRFGLRHRANGGLNWCESMADAYCSGRNGDEPFETHEEAYEKMRRMYGGSVPAQATCRVREVVYDAELRGWDLVPLDAPEQPTADPEHVEEARFRWLCPNLDCPNVDRLNYVIDQVKRVYRCSVCGEERSWDQARAGNSDESSIEEAKVRSAPLAERWGLECLYGDGFVTRLTKRGDLSQDADPEDALVWFHWQHGRSTPPLAFPSKEAAEATLRRWAARDGEDEHRVVRLPDPPPAA